jgi:hypothetical protein
MNLSDEHKLTENHHRLGVHVYSRSSKNRISKLPENMESQFTYVSVGWKLTGANFEHKLLRPVQIN